MIRPGGQEVADVIQERAQELEERGATVVDVTDSGLTTTVSNPSVITMEFKATISRPISRPLRPRRSDAAGIFDSGLFHPSLNGTLTERSRDQHEHARERRRLQDGASSKTALLKAMKDNDLDALIYPTIRQKPVFVPATSQAGEQLPCQRTFRSAGDLGARRLHARWFCSATVPVGMEFLGPEFTEGELLQLRCTLGAGHHNCRPPASTHPDIEPEWSHTFTTGSPRSSRPPASQFRFTAPGTETFAYIDPGMKSQHDTGKKPKPLYSGEFQDSHWHIRYRVPTNGDSASIFVDNLRAGGGVYNLFGPAVAQ